MRRDQSGSVAVAAAALLVLVLVGFVLAVYVMQPRPSGCVVRGAVLDRQSQKPLAGATVDVTLDAGGGTHVLVTGTGGRYDLPTDCRGGRIEVTAGGYQRPPYHQFSGNDDFTWRLDPA